MSEVTQTYYDFRIVGGGIPVVVFGPDGCESIALSDAFSAIFSSRYDLPSGNSLRTGPEDKCKAIFRNACAFFNYLTELGDGVGSQSISVAEKFVESVAACRQLQDKLFARFGRLEADRSNNTSFWFYADPKQWRLMAGMLSSIRMVTAALTAIGYYGGRDPSKVDAQWSRTKNLNSGKPWRVGADGQIRQDFDYRIRLARARLSAPRAECPLISVQIQEGLRRVDAPDMYGLICEFAAESGARWVSAAGMTIFDVLVVARRPEEFPCPCKGDKTEKRNFVAWVPLEVAKRITSYIDGPRADLSGYSLAELRALARNPKHWSLLRMMPVFTEDGVNPVSYQRFYRFFRMAAEKMGLFIDEDPYEGGITRRYATFHMLRHEYVYRRLEHAQTLPTDERELEYDNIVCYMAWKSWRMLDWYSHHFRLANAFDAVQAYIKARGIPTERLAASGQARDWDSSMDAPTGNIRRLVDEL